MTPTDRIVHGVASRRPQLQSVAFKALARSPE
jgi:hypothetical protein